MQIICDGQNSQDYKNLIIITSCVGYQTFPLIQVASLVVLFSDWQGD